VPRGAMLRGDLASGPAGRVSVVFDARGAAWHLKLALRADNFSDERPGV